MGHALLFAVRPESFEPGLFPDFDAFSDIPQSLGCAEKCGLRVVPGSLANW
jgi:hypothetical protein